MTSLRDLHDAFHSYMYVEDEYLLELVMAVAISREQLQAKLWLIIIGASSDGKTELVIALDNKITTKILKNFTAKTLVNGYVDKAKHPDLAPKLKNKLILIPEMASILKLHPNEKASVWAQLRDLYDGTAGKQSGEGVDILYEGLNVSFIGCSTPAIDSQVLIHQDLGTRELLYRTAPKDSKKLMEKVIENINNNDKGQKAKKFKGLVNDFLISREYKNIDLSPDSLNKIKELSSAITKLRATAEVDYSSGELNNLIYPEEPARVLSQLLVLYKSLKSLDDEYSDERAIKIIEKVVFSSCSEIRVRILITLIEKKGSHLSRKKVANKLKIGIKTAFRELNILYHLGLVELQETTPNPDEPHRTVKRWKIAEYEPANKILAHSKNLILSVDEEEIE